MRPATPPHQLLGLLLLLGGAGGLVAAEQQDTLSDDEVVVRTEGAHRVLLPKDWPVEEREGRFAPIPVEGYLGMKFDQVATTFNQISQRLDALERRLQQLEETQKTALLRLRLLENAQRASADQEGR